MKWLKRYKWTILLVVVVFLLIIMPGRDVPSIGIPHLDKVVHFCMFGSINFMFYLEYYFNNKCLPRFINPCIYLTIYGTLTEIVQYFVPGRSCDIKDLIADTLGILIVGLIMHTQLKKKLPS